MIDARNLVTQIARKAQSDRDYYIFGKPSQFGLLEEILDYLDIDYVTNFHSQSMHDENLKIIRSYLQNNATEEQMIHIYNKIVGVGSLPTKKYENNACNKVFIGCAMNKNDCPDYEQIEDTIWRAVQDAGYIPYLVDKDARPEDINQMVLENIQSCKFAIIDFTTQNRGAYYEAGYARGIGKKVIQTFRQCQPNDILHFDIRSIHTEFWETYDDLYKKLSNAIQHLGDLPH